MYEKILQKLKLQRGQKMSVTDKTLEDLAKSYTAFITTDEQLNAVDFTPVINTVEGNISHIASDAAKKAEEKAKAGIKPTVETPVTPPTPEPQKDDTPAWAKALIESNKALTEKVSKIEGEKTQLSRRQTLEKEIANTPDFYKKAILKGFDKANFQNDEEFQTYINEVKADAGIAVQEAKEKGLVFSAPGTNPQKPDPEGVTPEMEKTLKALTEVKEIKKPF